MKVLVILRGGGDIATGVGLRLRQAGLRVLVTELPQPLVVRRLVSFAEAVYRGCFSVEGARACRAEDLGQALRMLQAGEIPVRVDANCRTLGELEGAPGGPYLPVLVDARMTKRSPETVEGAARLVIGLGPGFTAGENCDAVIETHRGHFMGRAIWRGAAEADTGVPEGIGERRAERVLRAPAEGAFEAHAEIGDHLEEGDLVGVVDGHPIRAPFRGVLRGLIHPGLSVWRGLKVGDVDPRDDPRYCTLVSDKSLAVGGGVLEAILSRPDLRPFLWNDDEP